MQHQHETYHQEYTVSFPAQQPAAAPSDHFAAAPTGAHEDQAVQFLASIAPPSNAERTRAFAALLRAMNTVGAR